MRFKILGTEIYISFLFTAVITVMLATDRTGMIVPTLFSIIMHETGHLFAMWILDCNPKSIRLIPASIQITSDIARQYKTDITVALLGPITNFLLFGIFYFNYLSFGNKLVLYYALINLLIGLFNSLPVIGLDGGTVLFSLIAKKTDYNKACVILKIITIITAISIIIIGILFTIKGKVNPTIYIIGIYLFIMSLIKM